MQKGKVVAFETEMAVRLLDDLQPVPLEENVADCQVSSPVAATEEAEIDFDSIASLEDLPSQKGTMKQRQKVMKRLHQEQQGR